MATVVATLKAVLGLDDSAFKAGAKRAESTVGSLQKTMSGLGSMIAGAFSITAVVGFARHVGNLADKFRNLSDNLGVSTDALQALDNQFKTMGGSSENLNQMLNKVAQLKFDFETGDEKKRSEIMKDTGLATFDFAKPTEKLFERIAEIIAASANPAGTSANFFGRVGQTATGFMKTLGSSGTGVSGMVETERKAGRLMSEEAINKIDRAGDELQLALTKMTVAVVNAAEAIARAMKPIISRTDLTKNQEPFRISYNPNWFGAEDI